MQPGNSKLDHTLQDIAIEPALEADLDAILALQKLAYLSEAQRYNDSDLPPLRQTLAEIQADFARMAFFKATAGECIVGSVRGYAKDGTCYVGRLIVHPDVQGQGIGTRLMQTLEQHFGAVQRFELFTGHKSEPALHLYHKLGYRKFKCQDMTTHTVVFLEKAHISLDTIIAHKREEVALQKQARPLDVIADKAQSAPPPRDFLAALQAPGVSLIAEVKKASPSKGLLCPDFAPVKLARAYAANGAAAISVLTDARFFQGSLDDLRAARQAVDIPVLRKDFIVDAYQVYEARAAGADAVLLIVAALDDATLCDLYALICRLGMTALIEVHNAAELERALWLRPRLIGVNNRDLRTFHVTLDTVAALRPRIPDSVVVIAESGIHTPEDVARLRAIGVDAMLVGEALVTAEDVGEKVRQLTKLTANHANLRE